MNRLKFRIRNIYFKRGINIDEVRLNIICMFIQSRPMYNYLYPEYINNEITEICCNL